MKKGPGTPKGFRDIDPALAIKRRMVIGKIAEVLEEFEFLPMETPTVEFAEVLLGKYGEDERLIYQFTDRGGRKLALRYDLTLPLARYLANNPRLLSSVFRRYQIGQVFRGEKPQKGRWREFTQFDFDTTGDGTLAEDAKIIAAAISSAKNLGLSKVKMAVNDRKSFVGLSAEEIRQIDKIHKIGRDKIEKKLLDVIEELTATPGLTEIFGFLEKTYDLKEGKDFFFDPTLARGLDYYTSTIFELKPFGAPEELSVGGGGRYDNLIGMFAGKSVPAVGFSFGLDRLISLLPNE